MNIKQIDKDFSLFEMNEFINGLGLSGLTGSWFPLMIFGDRVTSVVINESCWASQMNAGCVEYTGFLPTFINRPLFHDSDHEYTYPHLEM